jgi:WD40 repeat protein
MASQEEEKEFELTTPLSPLQKYSYTQVGMLAKHTKYVNGLVYLPHGLLLSVAWDGMIMVWEKNDPVPGSTNDESWSCIEKWEAHSGKPITSVLHLSDGTVVTAGKDNCIKRWHPNGDCMKTIRDAHTGMNGVGAVALIDATGGPGRRKVVSVGAGGDPVVRVWYLSEGRCKAELEGHTAEAYTVMCLSDGRLLSGADDCTMRVWKLGASSDPSICVGVIKGHEKGVTALAELPSGVVVSGCKGGSIRLWSLSGSGRSACTGECVRVFRGHLDRVSSFCVLGDGRTLVSASFDKTMMLWDSEDRSKQPHVRTARGDILPATAAVTATATTTSTTISRTKSTGGSTNTDMATPDGSKNGGNTDMTSSSSSSSISSSVVGSVDTACSGILRGHQGWIMGMTLLTDNMTIISGGMDKTIRIWRC